MAEINSDQGQSTLKLVIGGAALRKLHRAQIDEYRQVKALKSMWSEFYSPPTAGVLHLRPGVYCLIAADGAVQSGVRKTVSLLG